MPNRRDVENCIEWVAENICNFFKMDQGDFDFLVLEEGLWRQTQPIISSRPGSGIWRFTPNAIAWDARGHSRLVLMNYSSAAISLKDIGELYCFATIVKPDIALLFSPKGVSNEVRLQLVDDDVANRLMLTKEGIPLAIGEWSVEHNAIIYESLLPIEDAARVFPIDQRFQ
jgi:hypothetical protein